MSDEGPCRAIPSLDELYSAHGRFVWSSLHRLGVHEKDLEDMLQEVFVVAHRRLGDFQGGASPRTWLYAISRRVASNYRRSAPVQRESSLEEGAIDEPVADGTGPERAAMDAEARAQLEVILSEIDLEKRAVFLMFEVELLPASEIAEITGVPVSTVHSRLAAARKLFERGLRRMNLLTEIKETES